MDTLLLSDHCPDDIQTAGKILRRGGLVAIPTETVYGLAANALDGATVKKIYAAKGRPSDNPLIVHISQFSQLAPLVREVPEAAKELADAFWPGPLTIILPKSGLVPQETSGGLSTVAVRCPSHPTARAVIDAAGVPLAAPSANLSGKPSPTTFRHVQEDLTGRVDALLDGGDCAVGVESTVLTLAEGTPRILRPGGITLSQLQSVLGNVEVDPAVLHQLEQGKKAASPGMKYKHYSPKADVVIVDASPEEYVRYVNKKGDGWALCFEEDVPFLQVPSMAYGSRYDSASQAHRLFDALHGLDEAGAKKAYAHIPRKRGVGLAVYNRLVRSAGFQVLNPTGHHVLGLTGPTGAGKSTVGEFLKSQGCYVIDCDQVTRSAQVYDGPCLAELSAAFGPEVVQDGALNRAELACRAFASEEARTRRSPSQRFCGGCASCWKRAPRRGILSWCWTRPPCLNPAWMGPVPASWWWTPPRRSALPGFSAGTTSLRRRLCAGWKPSLLPTFTPPGRTGWWKTVPAPSRGSFCFPSSMS